MNSGVQALAQDAMNDVVFKYSQPLAFLSNSLFSLIFPVIGYFLIPFL